MVFKLRMHELNQNLPSEFQECKAFWNWAQFNPAIGEYLIKHCNENQNKSWFIRALISIGMRPGIPDYQYPVANNKYHGLWIEMKSKKRGSKKGILQEKWIHKLLLINHYATYAYGCDEAIKITLDYIENRL